MALPPNFVFRGEGSSSENAVLFVDDCRDMQILMRVDAADNGADFWVNLHGHACSPDATDKRLHQDRLHGQDSNVTGRSGLSRVTGTGEAKPHHRAFPGGRQVRGKTLAGRSECGSGRTRSLAAPVYQPVHRCESQAARELAVTHLLSE